MKATLTGLIHAHESHFSKGQRRIAAFITEHSDEAAFMTAFRLGEEVGVSESTVVRFAAELGFDGYPQLQKAMQEMIRSKLTILQRLEVTRAHMADDEVLHDVAAADIHNIRQTMEEMDQEAFFGAVDTIVYARHLYVFAAGHCKALASFLTHYLQMLLGNPGTPGHRLQPKPKSLKKCWISTGRTPVIGISFPRYSARLPTTLHYARSKGRRVIALTDSLLSPIATHASYRLLAHSDMASIVDSLVAP